MFNVFCRSITQSCPWWTFTSLLPAECASLLSLAASSCPLLSLLLWMSSLKRWWPVIPTTRLTVNHPQLHRTPARVWIRLILMFWARHQMSHHSMTSRRSSTSWKKVFMVLLPASCVKPRSLPRLFTRWVLVTTKSLKCTDFPYVLYSLNAPRCTSSSCVSFWRRSPLCLQSMCLDAALFSSSLWGPSGDDMDQVVEHCLLPELNIGDWLIFSQAGAYSLGQPLCTTDDSPPPHVCYVMSSADWWGARRSCICCTSFWPTVNTLVFSQVWDAGHRHHLRGDTKKHHTGSIFPGFLSNRGCTVCPSLAVPLFCTASCFPASSGPHSTRPFWTQLEVAGNRPGLSLYF